MYEGVQYHMLNFLRRCTFGPESYFESGPKVRIRTIRELTKTAIWHMINSNVSFDPFSNCSHFSSGFGSNLDQKFIYEANPTRDTKFFSTLFRTKNWTPRVILIMKLYLLFMYWWQNSIFNRRSTSWITWSRIRILTLSNWRWSGFEFFDWCRISIWNVSKGRTKGNTQFCLQKMLLVTSNIKLVTNLF